MYTHVCLCFLIKCTHERTHQILKHSLWIRYAAYFCRRKARCAISCRLFSDLPSSRRLRSMDREAPAAQEKLSPKTKAVPKKPSKGSKAKVETKETKETKNTKAAKETKARNKSSRPAVKVATMPKVEKPKKPPPKTKQVRSLMTDAVVYFYPYMGCRTLDLVQCYLSSPGYWFEVYRKSVKWWRRLPIAVAA